MSRWLYIVSSLCLVLIATGCGTFKPVPPETPCLAQTIVARHMLTEAEIRHLTEVERLGYQRQQEDLDRQTRVASLAELDKMRSLENSTVFFDDAGRIADRSIPVMELQAQYLARNPHIFIKVESYMSSDQSRSYNLLYSQKLGKAVYDYMTAFGVDADRISIAAYGENILHENFKTADELNRRAIIRY